METTQNNSDQLPSIIPSQIRREISNNRVRNHNLELAKATAVFSKEALSFAELVHQLENLREDQIALNESLKKLKMKLVEVDMNQSIEAYGQSQQIDELYKRIEALELAQKKIKSEELRESPPPSGMYS